jgi:hypothetical protein
MLRLWVKPAELLVVAGAVVEPEPEVVGLGVVDGVVDGVANGVVDGVVNGVVDGVGVGLAGGLETDPEGAEELPAALLLPGAGATLRHAVLELD